MDYQKLRMQLIKLASIWPLRQEESKCARLLILESLSILKNGNHQWIPLQIVIFQSNRSSRICLCLWINIQRAFQWCVPYMLRKLNWIIAPVNLCVAKTTHKYEIEVLCTIAEALKIDEKNNNQEILSQYKEASGHIIFDVRMTLECKVW